MLQNGSFYLHTIYNNIAQDMFYLTCKLITTTKIVDWFSQYGVIYWAVTTDLDNTKHQLIRVQKQTSGYGAFVPA